MFKILCLLALGTLLPQFDCSEIAFWGKVFKSSEITPPPQEINNEIVKEHGNFDFFGRDLVRKALEKYNQVKEGVKETISRHTKGLDCNRIFSNGKEHFKLKVKAIFPGTKWCGDGNVSESYDDLGKFSSTDSCCREHDSCPDNIAASAIKYDLENTGLFTRSHCDCDRKFYECLKKTKSILAESIGFTYFTILGPQCFKQDYPIVKCLKEERGKCVEYSTDETGEKMYQWFDSPAF